MQANRDIIIVLLVGCCLAASAAAEDYNFEVGLSYSRGQTDFTSYATVNGVPDPSLGVTTSSSDADNIDLTGAWFYSGLSDSNGPKSRAAFMSRASSVALGYSRTDESASIDFTGGNVIPPFSGDTDADISTLAINLRHVWRESGWYALAGISRLELEASSVFNGMAASSAFDTTAYLLGVGKYLGNATTLDLSAAQVDGEYSDSTSFALTLSHVGAIGANWQYGIDLAYAESDVDGAGESYRVRGALYPTANFEFGIEYGHQTSIVGIDADIIEAFAGWFFRDNVELSALYRQIDPDAPGADDVDSYEFGVGVRVRF